MNRKKIDDIERLIVKKVSQHASFAVQIRDGVPVHFKVELSFRNDVELDAAIAQLKLHK